MQGGPTIGTYKYEFHYFPTGRKWKRRWDVYCDNCDQRFAWGIPDSLLAEATDIHARTVHP